MKAQFINKEKPIIIIVGGINVRIHENISNDIFFDALSLLPITFQRQRRQTTSIFMLCVHDDAAKKNYMDEKNGSNHLICAPALIKVQGDDSTRD